MVVASSDVVNDAPVLMVRGAYMGRRSPVLFYSSPTVVRSGEKYI